MDNKKVLTYPKLSLFLSEIKKIFSPKAHDHNRIKDVESNQDITLSFTKEDFVGNYFTVWNGFELRSMHKDKIIDMINVSKKIIFYFKKQSLLVKMKVGFGIKQLIYKNMEDLYDKIFKVA